MSSEKLVQVTTTHYKRRTGLTDMPLSVHNAYFVIFKLHIV